MCQLKWNKIQLKMLATFWKEKNQANIIEWYIIFTRLHHNYYNFFFIMSGLFFYDVHNNIHLIFKKIYAG